MPGKRVLKTEIVAKALKDPEFRRRLIANPRAAIQEAFEVVVPENLEIAVQEDTQTKVHVSLPSVAPALDEKLLEAVAGGIVINCGQSSPSGGIYG